MSDILRFIELSSALNQFVQAAYYDIQQRLGLL